MSYWQGLFNCNRNIKHREIDGKLSARRTEVLLMPRSGMWAVPAPP